MRITWSLERTDLNGSRWEVWESHFRDVLSWADFKDEAVRYNPHLSRQSNWEFVPGELYRMPELANEVSQAEALVFDEQIERNILAQRLLKRNNLYDGPIDGIVGSVTLGGLAGFREIKTSWSADRQIVAFLQLQATRNQIDSGVIDGFYGPQTEYALNQLLHVLDTGTTERIWRPEEIVQVNPYNWPKQYTAEFDTFYGPKGEGNLVKIDLPYPHRFSWEPDKKVTRFSCHKKVKSSLEKVLKEVVKHYGLDEIVRLRLDYWGGCFNDRAIRGGTKPSMHSWGIALDYDPDNNRLNWGRDRATFAQEPYDAWWRIWEAEGWVSLGRQRNFDWMHVQAAKV